MEIKSLKLPTPFQLLPEDHDGPDAIVLIRSCQPDDCYIPPNGTSAREEFNNPTRGQPVPDLQDHYLSPSSMSATGDYAELNRRWPADVLLPPSRASGGNFTIRWPLTPTPSHQPGITSRNLSENPELPDPWDLVTARPVLQPEPTLQQANGSSLKFQPVCHSATTPGTLDSHGASQHIQYLSQHHADPDLMKENQPTRPWAYCSMQSYPDHADLYQTGDQRQSEQTRSLVHSVDENPYVAVNQRADYRAMTGLPYANRADQIQTNQ